VKSTGSHGPTLSLDRATAVWRTSETGVRPAYRLMASSKQLFPELFSPTNKFSRPNLGSVISRKTLNPETCSDPIIEANSLARSDRQVLMFSAQGLAALWIGIRSIGLRFKAAAFSTAFLFLRSYRNLQTTQTLGKLSGSRTRNEPGSGGSFGRRVAGALIGDHTGFGRNTHHSKRGPSVRTISKSSWIATPLRTS
jgi:hypothetical protein